MCLIYSETVEGPALSLQSVHDVHGSDSLPPGVLRVCDGVTDHIFKEVTEHAPDLLVDVARDTLDATSSRKPPDGRLRDTLDILSHHLSMPLSTTLTKTFTTLASSRHL